jgi:aconitate hydratase
MAGSLAAQILDSHRVDERARQDGASFTSLRVDHVVLDESDALEAWLELAGSGFDRITIDLALVCAEPRAEWRGFESAARARYVRAEAERLGAVVTRVGWGLAEHVYLERYAAPGKLVLGPRGEIAGCGGLGALGLDATDAALAAALAGLPLARAMPPIERLYVRGTLPWWVGAQDLRLVLEQHPGRSRWRGAVIEVVGHGAMALPIAERVGLAREARRLDAQAILFASDERTRDYLRAQGREPDWKLLGSFDDGNGGANGNDPDAPPGARTLELDLDTIEPLAVDPLSTAGPRSARSLAGARVDRVTIGPYATYPHLAQLAAFVRGRQFAPGVDVVITPGSRRILETALRDGVLAELRQAGARLLEVGASTDRRRIGPPPSDGASLSYGDESRESIPHRHWRVGLMTAAASALIGRIADPRDVGGDRPPRDEPETYAVGDSVPRKVSATGAPPSPIEHVRSARTFVPIDGPIRGPVLLVVGDHIGKDDILPRTAKAERLWSDLPGLARRAFARRDASFADRALRCGGGLVVAGERFGDQHAAPRAAIALRELGVRVVLASSWSPAFRQDAIEHGLLPLSFANRDDARTLRPGDELELPTLPEGLEPNRPVVVRNLTRGGQLAARHDLDEREIAIVRAGGLLGGGTARGRGGRLGPSLEEETR